MLTTYCTTHVHSDTIGRAFAAGAHSQVVVGAKKLLPGDAVFYGWLRGLEPLLREAQTTGRDWYYIDNGYISAGHYAGYYRVTRNAYQHTGNGEGDSKRFTRAGGKIRAWRQDGRHIVVCPPGDLIAEHLGFCADEWLKDTIARLRQNTDRPIFVRGKDAGRPLECHLENAHALVTAISNAAVQSVLFGVPVFTTHRCAASSMGLMDLEQIENPVYPDDRLRWGSVLASNQWTLDEMRRGMAWKTLRAA